MNDRGKVPLTTYRFDFTRRSGGYFRIWLVSLFLFLKRHGQSPQAFADLIRRLRLQLHAKEDSRSFLQCLSTHPATEERIQRVEQQLSMQCGTPMS